MQIHAKKHWNCTVQMPKCISTTADLVVWHVVEHLLDLHWVFHGGWNWVGGAEGVDLHGLKTFPQEEVILGEREKGWWWVRAEGAEGGDFIFEIKCKMFYSNTISYRLKLQSVHSHHMQLWVGDVKGNILHELGKTFVEPQVVPPLHRHQVPEPLDREEKEKRNS